MHLRFGIGEVSRSIFLLGANRRRGFDVQESLRCLSIFLISELPQNARRSVWIVLQGNQPRTDSGRPALLVSVVQRGAAYPHDDFTSATVKLRGIQQIAQA